MTNGRVNPAQQLAHQGITGLGSVYYNLIEPSLVEEAVKRGEPAKKVLEAYRDNMKAAGFTYVRDYLAE